MIYVLVMLAAIAYPLVMGWWIQRRGAP